MWGLEIALLFLTAPLCLRWLWFHWSKHFLPLEKTFPRWCNLTVDLTLYRNTPVFPRKCQKKKEAVRAVRTWSSRTVPHQLQFIRRIQRQSTQHFSVDHVFITGGSQLPPCAVQLSWFPQWSNWPWTSVCPEPVRPARWASWCSLAPSTLARQTLRGSAAMESSTSTDPAWHSTHIQCMLTSCCARALGRRRMPLCWHSSSSSSSTPQRGDDPLMWFLSYWCVVFFKERVTWPPQHGYLSEIYTPPSCEDPLYHGIFCRCMTGFQVSSGVSSCVHERHSRLSSWY